MLIATTNAIELVGESLRKEGRLDKVINISMPNALVRK